MAMKLNVNIKNSLPIIFLFLVVFVFILPFFIFKSIPYAGDFTGSDLTELNLPLRFASAKSILSGQLPLWNHNLSNGFALLAEGQAGVFYPLNFIYLFTPFALAVNIGFFINFFLAAVFTYFFARVLSISRLGSVFSALAFAFSGFFIFHLKHLNMINAAIWLPLIFYLIEKYFQAEKKNKYLFFLPFVFAVQFFAGHPQISYLSVFSAFFYFLLLFIFCVADFKKVSITDWAKKVIMPWFFIGLFALGLSAVQFFPTLELSTLSERSSWINFDSSTVNIFPPRQLLTVFSPYLYGNPAKDLVDNTYNYLDIFWENNCYFGFLSVLFAIFALICLIKTERKVKFFAIFLLFLLFFIFGRYNFLYIFAWFLIPGLKLFRFSQRFLLPFILIFSVVAGIGFDLFIKLSKIVLDKYLNFQKVKIILTGLSLFFIVFLVGDIFLYSRQYVSALPADYFKPNRASEWLKNKNEPDNFSYLSLDWQDSWSSIIKSSGGWQDTKNILLYRNMLAPNLNMFFDLSTPDDRPWLEGGQLFKPMADVWLKAKDYQHLDSEKNQIFLEDAFLKIYGMQGVKYFLSYFNLNNEKLKIVEVFEDPPLPQLKIYENPYFLPKAFIINDYLIEKDQAKSLEKIANGFYDFSKEVMLEKSPDFLPDNNSILNLTGVKIVYWRNNQIKIKAETDKSSLLFLSLTNFPGWQAKINDQPVKILRANHAFSAIEIPAGISQVEFSFKPAPFYLGLMISVFTLFVLIFKFFILNYFFKLK